MVAVCPPQFQVKLPNDCARPVGAVLVIPVMLQFDAIFQVAVGIEPPLYACTYDPPELKFKLAEVDVIVFEVDVLVNVPVTFVKLFVVLKDEPFAPEAERVKLPAMVEIAEVPEKAIPIVVPPPGFAPVNVKLLPRLITNPVAAFVIVITRLPPDDVNVTVELLVIVRLLKFGGVTLTPIEELV
jgi:hypothetical protein